MVKVLAAIIAAVLLAVGGLAESGELKSTIVDETREIRRTLTALTQGQKEIRDEQRRFDERLRAVEIEQKAEQRVKNQRTWEAAMGKYLEHIRDHDKPK